MVMVGDSSVRRDGPRMLGVDRSVIVNLTKWVSESCKHMELESIQSS